MAVASFGFEFEFADFFEVAGFLRANMTGPSFGFEVSVWLDWVSLERADMTERFLSVWVE